MIRLDEIIRSGAMFLGTQPLLIEPAFISRVQPCDMPGFEGDACVLRVGDQEEKVFVTGSFEDIHRAIDGAELTALDRLAAIKELVDGA